MVLDLLYSIENLALGCVRGRRGCICGREGHMHYPSSEEYQKQTLTLLEGMSETLTEVADEIADGLRKGNLLDRDKLRILALKLEERRRGLLLLAELSRLRNVKHGRMN